MLDSGKTPVPDYVITEIDQYKKRAAKDEYDAKMKPLIDKIREETSNSYIYRKGDGKHDTQDRKIIEKYIHEILQTAGHGDIHFVPPLTNKEANAIHDKILKETNDILNMKPGHTLESIIEIIKNRGKDVPADKNISLEMHHALLQYKSLDIAAEGNYLPMHKQVAIGKNIT